VRNLWRAVTILPAFQNIGPVLLDVPKNDCCFDRLSKALSIPDGIYIVSKEIEAEAVLENCRALIDQVIAGLSAEKPFINVSSAEELLLHRESAASALKRSLLSMPLN
jgi:hypothetical protein